MTTRLPHHEGYIISKRESCTLAEPVLQNNYLIDWENIRVLEKN